MAHLSSFLYLITVVLLTYNCCYTAYIDTGDDDTEAKVLDVQETLVDFELLDNIEKRSSLIYAFSDDCVPKGSFCHYPYGAYYLCCENTGCFCNRLGFCTCKSYDETSNDE